MRRARRPKPARARRSSARIADACSGGSTGGRGATAADRRVARARAHPDARARERAQRRVKRPSTPSSPGGRVGRGGADARASTARAASQIAQPRPALSTARTPLASCAEHRAGAAASSPRPRRPRLPPSRGCGPSVPATQEPLDELERPPRCAAARAERRADRTGSPERLLEPHARRSRLPRAC